MTAAVAGGQRLAAGNPAGCTVAEVKRVRTSCCAATGTGPGRHIHPAAVAAQARLDMGCSLVVPGSDTAAVARAAARTLGHTAVGILHSAGAGGIGCTGHSSLVAGAADLAGAGHPDSATWRRFSRARLMIEAVSTSVSVEDRQRLGRVVNSWWCPASRRAARNSARNPHRVSVGAQRVEGRSRRWVQGYVREATVRAARLPIACTSTRLWVVMVVAGRWRWRWLRLVLGSCKSVVVGRWSLVVRRSSVVARVADPSQRHRDARPDLIVCEGGRGCQSISQLARSLRLRTKRIGRIPAQAQHSTVQHSTA